MQTDTSTVETTTEQETILGAKPSEVAGIPETYDLASVIPEGMELDQTRMESFTELAKESGLSQEKSV